MLYGTGQARDASCQMNNKNARRPNRATQNKLPKAPRFLSIALLPIMWSSSHTWYKTIDRAKFPTLKLGGSLFVFGNAVGSRYSTLTAHKRRSPFSSCLRIVREAVAFSSHVCLDLTWYAETRAMAGGLLHCILDMLRCNVESRAFRDVGGKSVLCRRRVWRRLNQDFHQCRYSSSTPDADNMWRSRPECDWL